MSKPQVFCYVTDREKALVKRVSDVLDVSESVLMRAAALPTLKKVYGALRAGHAPEDIRRTLVQRVGTARAKGVRS